MSKIRVGIIGNGSICRFRHAAVKSDGAPAANAVLIGFEYSTNDDNQEVVALVENVRPSP